MRLDFDSIPVLSYSLVQTDREAFINQLRTTIATTGFLYLSEPPLAPHVIPKLIEQIPKLFDLPQEEKDAIIMRNSPHFLGYSRLATEFTRGKTDQREQFDFATLYDCQWKEGDPDYIKLWGQPQWPKDELIPEFKPVFLEYLAGIDALSAEFTTLISEALGLGPDGLTPYFEPKEGTQHRSKIVKYPTVDTVASDQGVGPHFDAGFLTFLLQASGQPGLQVQNLSGKWVDVPPIPNTLVVNIGRGLETITQGVTKATSHRVLNPPPGTGARYSVPFFQNIGQKVCLAKLKLDLPKEVLKLRDMRGDAAAMDSINFSEYDSEVPAGQVNLIGRCKSHPDVAAVHYPELYKQIFPQGAPSFASAY